MSDNDFEEIDFITSATNGDGYITIDKDCRLINYRKPNWEARFFGGEITVHLVSMNFFHRWMWSLLLGAKWRKLNV